MRIAAAMGAVLLAALMFWWARAGRPGGDVVAAVRPLAPAAAVAPTAAPAPHVPTQVVVPYVKPPASGAIPAVGANAAAEYRRRARYPRSAQPLTADEPDPILRDRETSPVESRGRNGSEPTLRVFPAATS